MFCCILSISFLYGLYEYQFCSLPIKGFFETLFILKKEQNEYPLYLLQNTIFIFLNTYLSSIKDKDKKTKQVEKAAFEYTQSTFDNLDSLYDN